ncbi:MAG: hypothetical protein SFX72_08095 [Isosphaeraceae bacterium]|nr:hypothetical protein [Isosphaeraceae bacterium]
MIRSHLEADCSNFVRKVVKHLGGVVGGIDRLIEVAGSDQSPPGGVAIAFPRDEAGNPKVDERIGEA